MKIKIKKIFAVYIICLVVKNDVSKT